MKKKNKQNKQRFIAPFVNYIGYHKMFYFCNRFNEQKFWFEELHSSVNV